MSDIFDQLTQAATAPAPAAGSGDIFDRLSGPARPQAQPKADIFDTLSDPAKRFAADPGIQKNAEDYVAQQWQRLGQAAAHGEGDQIRDFATKAFGPSTPGYDPVQDDNARVGYVKSSIPVDQRATQEDQWRQEYLSNALPETLQHQQQVISDVQNDQAQTPVGRVRGLVNSQLRGAANIITQPVAGGANLIQGAATKFLGDPTNSADPYALAQQATQQALGQVQGNIDKSYRKSTSAQQNPGGVMDHIENGTEMIPSLVLMGQAFQAGGMQKVLALSQVAGQNFQGGYQDAYRAVMQRGGTPEQANNAALGAGLIDSAVNTYLMKYGAFGHQDVAGMSMLRAVLTSAAKDAVAQGGVGLAQGTVSEMSKYVTAGEAPDIQRIFDTAANNAIGGLGTGAVQGAMGSQPGVAEAPPAPSPEQLQHVLTAPQAQPETQQRPTPAPTAPVAEPKLPAILDAHTPKYRVTQDGESKGVPLTFESPVDKALYEASQPRKGKLSKEAAKYLDTQGVTDWTAKADQLRDHVDNQASLYDGGDSIHVPAFDAAKHASAPAAVEPDLVPEPKEYLPAKDDREEVLSRVMPEAAVVTAVPEPHQEVLNVYKELTGKEAIPYTGGRGRGFRSDDATFYNVDRNNTPQLRREAIAHEATHWLQDNRPDLVAKLDAAIPVDMKQKLLDEYRKMFVAQEGKDLDPAKFNREAQAMIVGRAFARPGVARAVIEDNPSLFVRAANALTAKLRSLTAGGKVTNQVISFLRTAREEAARSGGTSEPQRGVVSDRAETPAFLPQHNQAVRDEAEEYARTHGIPYTPDTQYASVNTERAKKIADAYANAKHEPSDSHVKAAYDAMKAETLDQWNFLQSKGVKFEPWKKEGQPYKDSAEMMQDVTNNRHLYFFQGGEMPADHPLAEKAPGTDDLTYNDVFRAVHDYFGHTKEGVGFGPRGEENAWRSHSQMYSPLAREAMTTETRGQNSWVNYGPFGEHNQANPTDTHYAEQKATVLPAEFQRVEREAGPDFLPSKEKDREAALDNLSSTDIRKTPLNAEDTMFGKGAAPKTKIEDVARLLNERTKQLAGQAKAREAEKLSRAIAAGVPEAQYQLKEPDSGKDWYKADIAKMEKTMTALHPELKDPSHMTVFKAILAITSQGNNPNVNLKHAEPIYAHWKDTGDILTQQPTGINWPGTLGENYRLPLGRLQNMLTEMGTEGTAKWLLSKHTVGEINQWSEDHGFNANVAGPKDTPTYGMEIFGPKIGVFALNQHGIQEKITKDMWFSRTWNRWMGTMMENGEIVDAPRNDDEREVMDKAVNILAGKLKMDPSEVQAVLWYYEQQLWKAHGAKVESGSYSKAAEKVANGDRYDLRAALAKGEGNQSEGTGQDASSSGLYAGDGGKRAASSEPDFLPSPAAVGQKFYEDDLKSLGERVGTAIDSALRGVRTILAPQTAGPDARFTANRLRERGGELAQRYDRLGAAFGEAKDYFDSVPKTDTRDFINRMETKAPQATPALQKIADGLRAVADDRLKQVQALGTGKLAQFVQNYFPHLWKDPTKASGVYAEQIAKAPLEGSKGWLKQRTLPLFSDGIARGLEPVTENPVEAMMLRIRQMDKYITAHQAFADMAGKGLLKSIKAREQVPDGYAKINDNIATTYAAPSRRGAIQIQGYKVAPQAVADVINNYLSPGLRGDKKFGGLFRGYLGLGNLMNQVQLGLSPFHAAMTTMNASVSKMALAIEQAKGGDWAGAGKSAAGIVPAVYSNLSQGNLLMKEWFHPGSTTPEIATLADALKKAGGRVGMDQFYQSGMADKAMEAFRKGNILGGMMRGPSALIEKAASPIMEHFVPRVKLGAFMDLARQEIAKLGPGAPDEQVRHAMGQAWDSIDNRFGQLVYDNLFWNKAAKDLAMASTRSVGWNLGTLRELGGGIIDTGKLLSGKGEVTHRMAYLAALPLITGLVGGLMHYGLSGQAPSELKDYFFPKTGEKDHSGHDMRLALPSYMNDMFAYAKNPAKTLADKAHPLVATIFQMLKNEDYYGTKIANEDDPFMRRLLDRAEFAGKQFLPFSATNVAQFAQGGTKSSLLPLVGLRPARKDLSYSPAELKAQELMAARSPVGGRTSEQAERSAKVRDLAFDLRTRKAGAQDAVRLALQKGDITDSDVGRIKEHMERPGFTGTIQRMDIGDAMKVWDVMQPEEKKQFGPIMFEKLRQTKAIGREDRVNFMQRLQTDWKAVKAGK